MLMTAVLILAMASCVNNSNEKPSEAKDTPVVEKPSIQEQAPVVGPLTAYYATEDFNAGYFEYKKGQLICDSNDPINRIVENDADNYKYEGDDTGEYYSWLLPKSKVEKKTFTMNQLTPQNVGNKAVFVSSDGCTAKIFWSNINGHQYYNYDGSEENWRETERLSECYVLSVELISAWSGEKYLFEEQLEEKQGFIKLFAEDPYGRDHGLVGFVVEKWLNKEGWGYAKTAYDESGKLLVDQWECADIPEYISIAYIADLDALYIEGDLYLRKL